MNKRWAVHLTAQISSNGRLVNAMMHSIFPSKQKADEWIERQNRFKKDMGMRYKVVEEEYCIYRRTWSETETEN